MFGIEAGVFTGAGASADVFTGAGAGSDAFAGAGASADAFANVGAGVNDVFVTVGVVFTCGGIERQYLP